jgi:putative PEP-CTERM system TPR-repeat lipoprotein
LEQRGGATPLSLNLKGLVLYAQNKRDESIKAFEAALKAEPAFLPAAQNLANFDLAEGNIAAAKKRFEGVLAKDEKNLQAMLAHAALSKFSGDWDTALEVLHRAVKAHPSVMESRAMLVEVLLAKQSVTQAVQAAEDTLAAMPQHPRSYLLVSQGSTNAAAQALGKWVQRDPASAEARYQLARVQIVGNQNREAEASARKAMELQPGYPAPVLLLATLLANDRRDDEARALSRDVQKRYPKAALGFAIEGELLEARGKHKEALLLYQKAFDTEPSSSMALRVFRAKKSLGDLKSAMGDAAKWVKQNPDDIPMRSVLAYELLRAGDAKGAAEHYERMSASPSLPNEWLNNLAYAYFKMGDARALPTAEKALKMRPNDAATIDTMAQIYIEKREFKKAVELLRKATSLAPEDPELRYHLGLALERSGDKIAAKTELSRALSSKKDFVERQSALKALDSIR